jgi:hypothetical protein
MRHVDQLQIRIRKLPFAWRVIVLLRAPKGGATPPVTPYLTRSTAGGFHSHFRASSFGKYNRITT